jgi:hypothetical protein
LRAKICSETSYRIRLPLKDDDRPVEQSPNDA